MRLKPFGCIQGQPNWQLVRVKDCKLRLALPALLNRLGPHAQEAISLIQLKEKARTSLKDTEIYIVMVFGYYIL